MMKKSFKRAALAAAVLATGLSGQASAAIIDFEDASPFFFSEINDGYAGYNWDQAWAMHETSLLTVFPTAAGSGFDTGTTGQYAAYGANANDVTVSVDSGRFDLGSVDLTAAWQTGMDITVTGLLNGNTLYSQTVTVDHTAATTFDFDFLGIDELIFSTTDGTNNPAFPFGGAFFVMDNLELDPSVPEPGTLSLLAAGLAGFAWKRRKQKQAEGESVAA